MTVFVCFCSLGLFCFVSVLCLLFVVVFILFVSLFVVVFFMFVCLFFAFCFCLLLGGGKWACLDLGEIRHLGTAGILYSVIALLTTAWVSFVLVVLLVVVIGSTLVTVSNSESNRLQQIDKAVWVDV